MVIRPPAVAGLFYPDDPQELSAALRHVLHAADHGARGLPTPKAIIAPHAGYVYSGAVAASAYVRLISASKTIRRVVLIGPCHRVPLRGLAAPSAAAFDTPLGRVPIDAAAIADVLQLPQVRQWDAPHAEEHSLEVHLPFLQALLAHFSVVPLVAGACSAEEVSEVLLRLWGGSETLIVISSDLSHYHDYATARRLDAETRRAIEGLDTVALRQCQACGLIAIAGLLLVARDKNLEVTTLDLRNSGDTASDRRRVVGYGAWMFCDGKRPPAPGGS